jgi:S-adenosylmethionine hydrolase
MSLPGIITLTTDFGTADTFVGQMKGAILSVAPEARIVDLTHEVPAHDVAAGGFALRTAYAAFPPGTVHVAVVDPGVGTSRRGLVVRTQRFLFVAPDNGLLSAVLEEEPLEEAFVLEDEHYRLPETSATFEGRDVFSPAAAWLLRGILPEGFGPPAGDLVRLDLSRARPEHGRPARVRAVAVDRFGNVTLDLPRHALEPMLNAPGEHRVRVVTDGGVVNEMHRTYGDAKGDRPFLLFNSAGYLEIAVREGRATDRLRVRAGDEVAIIIGPTGEGSHGD